MTITQATDVDLIDYLERAAVAVHIAVDAVVADDLSPKLTAAAEAIRRLTARVEELEEIVDTDDSDLSEVLHSLEQASLDLSSMSSDMDRSIELLRQIGQPVRARSSTPPTSPASASGPSAPSARVGARSACSTTSARNSARSKRTPTTCRNGSTW